MRNYRINIDKMINQLTPHYLGGRKLVLFLQSLGYPLKHVENKWAKWSRETYQESAMTSQVFLFEHFLTERFQQYFVNPADKITITDTEIEGIVLYWEYVQSRKKHIALYHEKEGAPKNPYFFFKDEKQKYSGISFLINFPAFKKDMITEHELTGLVRYLADRYVIAGKNYKINYNNKQQ